ncbi:MAG: EpsD family peptidyl-prolyl cis-trans isomerase [Betaproteobacteria bacterium]
MTNKSRTLRRAALTATVVFAAVLLAACGGHKKDATQAAARVNGTEITVHQINYRLQRERGLRPEQMDDASRKVLEQLIDEQLIVDKAEKVKMDQDPAAAQALLAARREVLARAYVEQAAQSVPAPTEQAMHAYFDANDALFAHRRVYTLQEYLARVPVDKIPALTALVEGGKSVAEIEAWFKAQNIPFRGQQSTHPAEQIPLNSVKTLAAVQDGHGLVAAAGEQVHVTYITSSTLAPVIYEKAKGAIGQFLSTEARRKATEGNLGALRSVAKITYAAPYEALAASASTFSLKDVEAASQAAANGARVSLPANSSSGVQVSLPANSSSSVQVSLPTSTSQGVRVSLPTTAASSVEVRLPPQTGADTGKK